MSFLGDVDVGDVVDPFDIIGIGEDFIQGLANFGIGLGVGALVGTVAKRFSGGTDNGPDIVINTARPAAQPPRAFPPDVRTL